MICCHDCFALSQLLYIVTVPDLVPCMWPDITGPRRGWPASLLVHTSLLVRTSFLVCLVCLQSKIIISTTATPLSCISAPAKRRCRLPTTLGTRNRQRHI